VTEPAISRKARQRMGLNPEDGHELDLEIEQLVMDAYGLQPEQRQRIVRTLRSVQRLRVIREMFPADAPIEGAAAALAVDAAFTPSWAS